VTSRTLPESVPADPSRWSESSQRSVSAEWTTEYTSYRYSCWRCRTSSVFSAADQQYTYEVKKAPIDQKRILCEPCWKRSNAISSELAKCEHAWSTSKASLRTEKQFLERWAKLLTEREEYVPYKHDVARKNMLTKLLSDA
jgi:Probable zinc-ribbon domain